MLFFSVKANTSTSQAGPKCVFAAPQLGLEVHAPLSPSGQLQLASRLHYQGAATAALVYSREGVLRTPTGLYTFVFTSRLFSSIKNKS